MSRKRKSGGKQVAHICIDVESTGPTPMDYSMVQLGAVDLDGNEFYAELKPLPGHEIQQKALQATGLTYDTIIRYPEASEGMDRFYAWLLLTYRDRRPIMWSDNPAFDWQFVNGYLWRFCKANPMGFSARRIGDFYAGMHRQPSRSVQWKRFRDTEHTHNALDDARGNAEALAKLFAMAKGDMEIA